MNDMTTLPLQPPPRNPGHSRDWTEQLLQFLQQHQRGQLHKTSPSKTFKLPELSWKQVLAGIGKRNKAIRGYLEDKVQWVTVLYNFMLSILATDTKF